MFEVDDGPGAAHETARDPSLSMPPEIDVRVSGRRRRETRWLRAGSPGDTMRVLIAARDKADLSNPQIARELGISHSGVQQLIKGEKHPSLLLVVRWLGVCGWDLLAVER